MTIPSPQTELGHLALVVSTSDFTTANAGTPFNVPTDPGLAPTDPTTVTTAGRTRAETAAADATSTATDQTSDLAFTGPEATKPNTHSTRTVKPRQRYVTSS